MIPAPAPAASAGAQPSTSSGVVILSAGPCALLVELADLAAVRRYYADAQRRRRGGLLPTTVLDIVPAARTLLFDGLDDPTALARDLPHWHPVPPDASTARHVEVPTIYDGADLLEVARLWDMTREEVISTHSSGTHEVAFLGFAPGFAYISGLPPQHPVPRRAKPRTQVPAGSVALAGEFTGIYPRRSPGGWQLIGRTELTLWDPDHDPASTLSPGTIVTFTPLTQ